MLDGRRSRLQHRVVDSKAQANRVVWEGASQKYVREYADLPQVVHLQSGHGLDDVALVQAGAECVVGIDYSQVAVRAAQHRADEFGVACRYVVAAVPGCSWPARASISWTPGKEP